MRYDFLEYIFLLCHFFYLMYFKVTEVSEVKVEVKVEVNSSEAVVQPACWLNFLRKALNSLFNFIL